MAIKRRSPMRAYFRSKPGRYVRKSAMGPKRRKTRRTRTRTAAPSLIGGAPPPTSISGLSTKMYTSLSPQQREEHMLMMRNIRLNELNNKLLLATMRGNHKSVAAIQMQVDALNSTKFNEAANVIANNGLM